MFLALTLYPKMAFRSFLGLQIDANQKRAIASNQNRLLYPDEGFGDVPEIWMSF
jgi:hypothetical protein